MTLSVCHYRATTRAIAATRQNRAVQRRAKIVRFAVVKAEKARAQQAALQSVKTVAQQTAIMGAVMKTQATALYPFVPSGKDFPKAISFMKALGFEEQWNAGGYAGLRFGGAYFILQQVDAPQWAEQQMVVYEVEDLDAYWEEVEAKNLASAYPGTKANPPKEFPWGREIHIIDPAGVCWHIRQKAE